MFDITEKVTFSHVSDWFSEIKKHSGENVIRFLVGNKSDLGDQRALSKEEC